VPQSLGKNSAFFSSSWYNTCCVLANSKPLRTSFTFIRLLNLCFFAGILLSLVSFHPKTARPEVSLVDQILSSTNQYRKSNSKPALQMRNDLNEIARKHSQNMANGRTSFGHDGFDQRHDKVKKIFHACTMSENVAYGRMDGEDVVSMWKGSSGHRKNLLGDYKYIGIGVATDRKGVTYFTQIFVK
jgi:uncharacterized protein YkwD